MPVDILSGYAGVHSSLSFLPYSTSRGSLYSSLVCAAFLLDEQQPLRQGAGPGDGYVCGPLLLCEPANSKDSENPLSNDSSRPTIRAFVPAHLSLLSTKLHGGPKKSCKYSKTWFIIWHCGWPQTGWPEPRADGGGVPLLCRGRDQWTLYRQHSKGTMRRIYAGWRRSWKGSSHAWGCLGSGSLHETLVSCGEDFGWFDWISVC